MVVAEEDVRNASAYLHAVGLYSDQRMHLLADLLAATREAEKVRTVDKVSDILGRCVQSVIVGVLGDG